MLGEAPRTVVIDRDGLQALLEALGARGYTLIAPTVRDGAIVYDEVEAVDDLPAGVTEVQGPGSYRLSKRDDAALFGYAVGPHSWKKYLFRPETVLFRARLDPDGGFVSSRADDGVAPRYAFLGVRACEIAAIDIQDQVFLRGSYRDPDYGSRRDGAFVIAVQCGEPGGTCFCVSMHTGPRAESGFDLALTELIDAQRHELLVEVGSERGEQILGDVPSRPALPGDLSAARAVTDDAASRMGRTLEADGLPQRLAEVLEHPQWDDVASRCLACTNCTLVCPTCFCSSVEDTTDLTGTEATRTRKWDSCFTLGHSYIHGGSIRASTRDRYRQWLTHKLSTWVDQFGTSGCVGCGRCITWCPVGIDLTAEVRALLTPAGASEVLP
ncbi:MAG TPA: 4Fe-4S dicluster domain-containing protein [Acidimicrobiia bacterium]